MGLFVKAIASDRLLISEFLLRNFISSQIFIET